MSGFDANAIKKKLQPVAKKKAQQMAKEFSEDMEREWLSIVDKFYDDYTPKMYVRHEYRGGTRGLYKTYDIYAPYTVAKENAVYGGININSSHMYTDYGVPETERYQAKGCDVDFRESSQTVLEYFWSGWHGHIWGQFGNTDFIPSDAALISYWKLYKKYLKRCSV